MAEIQVQKLCRSCKNKQTASRAENSKLHEEGRKVIISHLKTVLLYSLELLIAAPWDRKFTFMRMGESGGSSCLLDCTGVKKIKYSGSKGTPKVSICCT